MGPRRRFWPWLLLGAFSLLAILPSGTSRALDARTGMPVPGVHLEMPAVAIWLEPLAAPLHVVAGAPDYRTVGGWTFAWVFTGLGLAGWRLGSGASLRRGLGWAAAATVGLLFWLAVGIFLPVPGWRLVVDDPSWVVADLHSHTYTSHDGLVSARDNLATHADHGYEVVAVTDHNRPEGGFDAQRDADNRGPAVLAGVEERSPLRAYLLGIGLRPGIPVVARRKGRDPGFERRFIENVHRDHGGAVLVLSHRLEPADVSRLADEGVDGFEIANFGHPAPPAAVARALRSVALARGLPLVASTDWHGWSAWFRTWTLVRKPGDGDPGQAVLDILRAHRADAVVPVVAGPMGAVAGWRAAVMPGLAVLRYVRGLTPQRLGAWWLWLLGLAGLTRELRRRVDRPATLLGATGIGIGSFALWWRGIGWVVVGTLGRSAHPFPTAVGFSLLCAALVGLGVAALTARRAWRVSGDWSTVPEVPAGSRGRALNAVTPEPR